MRGREVHEPVGVERVAGARDVEAEVEPVAGRGLRHAVLHRDGLLAARAVLLGQVGRAVDAALARGLGVELEAAPRHGDVVAVLELGQRGLEAALADVAPRARDVRPDLDVHDGGPSDG